MIPRPSRATDGGPTARETSRETPRGAARGQGGDGLRRLDGRFLLPWPREGRFDHLVLLGGPPGIAEVAREAGLARRVSASLPAAGSADALMALHGSGVPAQEAARCLAQGGCAWFELDSRRRIPRDGRLRTTGIYAVLPGFERAAAYVPLEPPGALRWYARNLLPAWTPGKTLRRWGLRGAGEILLPWRYALTAVATPEGSAPPSALPSWLEGLRLLLLAHGPDRAVLLPFAPDGAVPTSVIKVPRLPRFNARTEGEQALLAHLRARLGPAARGALPEPRGIHRAGRLALGRESHVPGRPLAQRVGAWGAPFRRKARDLQEAADWLAGFHERTEVRRAEWDSTEAAPWIDAPLDDLRASQPGLPGLDGLAGAVRRRSRDLAGAGLPLVCQHRDFTPWNLLCGKDGLVVIDWEGARPGPALCDLLHFATHWSELAARAFDERARLKAFREVWIERRGGRVGEAARRAVAGYCQSLRIDRRFVPLLLAATWVELALRREGPGPEAAYVATLGAGAGELFGGWIEPGWR
ncbi:MAG: phosphotransferase family protein [Thermoanaerobaculia bacterium]